MRLNTNYKNCGTFITLGFETQLNLFSKNHNFEKKKKSSNKYPKKNLSFKIFKKQKKDKNVYKNNTFNIKGEINIQKCSTQITF